MKRARARAASGGEGRPFLPRNFIIVIPSAVGNTFFSFGPVISANVYSRCIRNIFHSIYLRL